MMLDPAVVQAHGFEVARAVGQRWVVDPADAAIVFDRVLRIAPAFVHDSARGVRVTYALKLRVQPHIACASTTAP